MSALDDLHELQYVALRCSKTLVDVNNATISFRVKVAHLEFDYFNITSRINYKTHYAIFSSPLLVRPSWVQIFSPELWSQSPRSTNYECQLRFNHLKHSDY
jgi:hypothetical protein